MTLSMHQASVSVFARQLTSLSGLLTKGAAFADEQQIDPSTLIEARLAPDMHPLARQVQIASDAAKGGCARLAGIDIPSYPDDETSFDTLQQRIAKTIAFIEGIAPEAFDGAETKTVAFKAGPYDLSFTGAQFLQNFALPNLFFHVSMTYAILRQNGVPLGKIDFLGGF